MMLGRSSNTNFNFKSKRYENIKKAQNELFKKDSGIVTAGGL